MSKRATATIRMPHDEYEYIKQAAAIQKMSVNKWCQQLLVGGAQVIVKEQEDQEGPKTNET